MGRRITPLQCVPTIKQTWPWQISFESPFTKRLNPTICRTQYSHKNHLRQEVSGSNSLLIPRSSTPLRSSVRQPFFFLFFCRSVRSRSHARSDKASNLSGPKIYSNLPYPKCFNIDVVTRSPIKKQRKIQKNLQINDGNASNLQIFKSQKFGTSPNHPLVFLGIWTHYLDIFPHTECSKLDPKLPHIALPGWFLLEGTCLRK